MIARRHWVQYLKKREDGNGPGFMRPNLWVGEEHLCLIRWQLSVRQCGNGLDCLIYLPLPSFALMGREPKIG